jgi:hypothetical protein
MQNLERIREWQRRNPEKVSAYKRKWAASNPEKIYEKNLLYRSENTTLVQKWKKEWRALNPERERQYKRNLWKNNPEKLKARNAVYYAVRTGKLIRPDHCSKCSKECKPHGHHYRGYEYKLDIIWLCETCHHLEHLLPPATICH